MATSYRIQETWRNGVQWSIRVGRLDHPLPTHDLRSGVWSLDQPPIPTHPLVGRAHTHPLSMGMGGYWVGTGYGYPVQDSATQ